MLIDKTDYMELFLLAVILIGLAVVGIGIKMFVKPGGMFTKKCANSFDPYTGKYKECICRGKDEEECDDGHRA